ncbi:MAG: imidazole glycerol phosphate synthase subunit HisH [Flavobacteriales bacterium]|nr:imidazole glycerol phosphate synthase subunit HisH [Flavobacteriales bacterium]
MIAIIDYGAGNVKSVYNALNRLGAESLITSDSEQIKGAHKVIFPGVGHAKPAMEKLQRSGLDEVIKNLKQPVLGICLGMQLMCSHSNEGDVSGLGIFTERVRKFEGQIKIPHMGWNELIDPKGSLFEGITEGSNVYFVHSYFVEMGSQTSAKCEYLIPFSASLRERNFFGVQFHPEKSGEIGSKILSNFLNMNS